MEDIEDKGFRIEQHLRKCKKEELAKVLTGLQIEFEDEETERNMLRKVGAKLDDATTVEEKTKLLLAMIPLVPMTMSGDIMKILLGKTEVKEESVANQSINDVSQVLQAMGFEPGATNSALRREFKISGTIGAPSQKDRVTYINLCSQVEDAKSKSYSTKEIAQAIRKSVSSGTELRTVLDAKTEMSLETMLTFIRGYLQEKTAAELYNELNSMCQAEDEDPQTFVLRAMGIREKIMKASAAEPTGAHYDRNMIQNMFLHTIRTGLKDFAIKSEVKDLLRDGETLDEDILSALNTAALEEHQRKTKTEAVQRKKVSINEASVGGADAAGAGVMDEIMSPLLDTMTLMKEEIQSLREDLSQMKAQRSGGRGGWRGAGRGAGRGANRGGKRGCEHCAKDGNGATCKHCWICGAGDHMSFDCRKTSNN